MFHIKELMAIARCDNPTEKE